MFALPVEFLFSVFVRYIIQIILNYIIIINFKYLYKSTTSGNGRFYDPRTKQAFKYDHLRKEASDYQDQEADAQAESWRAALDLETLAYTANHYRHGVSSQGSK